MSTWAKEMNFGDPALIFFVLLITKQSKKYEKFISFELIECDRTALLSAISFESYKNGDGRVLRVKMKSKLANWLYSSFYLNKLCLNSDRGFIATWTCSKFLQRVLNVMAQKLRTFWSVQPISNRLIVRILPVY